MRQKPRGLERLTTADAPRLKALPQSAQRSGGFRSHQRDKRFAPIVLVNYRSSHNLALGVVGVGDMRDALGCEPSWHNAIEPAPPPPLRKRCDMFSRSTGADANEWSISLCDAR